MSPATTAATTAIATIAAMFAFSDAAVIGADVEERIARCADHARADDRISCLEGVIRRMAASEATTGADGSGRDQVTPPESGTDSRAAEPAITDAAERIADAVPELSTPVDAQTRVAESTTQAKSSEQLGLSEAQRDLEPLESVNVVVVALRKNAYGKLLFTTENDQLWRQTDKRKPRYRELPFEAEIRRGAAGSFFIQPLSGGISVRVKRDR